MTTSNGQSAAAPAASAGASAAGASPDRNELADRVWTVPNALSVLRLLGVPLFLWLVLGPHADGWAIVVLALSGVSDWADGKLARRATLKGGRSSTSRRLAVRLRAVRGTSSFD